VLAAGSAEPQLLGPALSAHAPCSSAGAVPLRAESAYQEASLRRLASRRSGTPASSLRGRQTAAGIHLKRRYSSSGTTACIAPLHAYSPVHCYDLSHHASFLIAAVTPSCTLPLLLPPPPLPLLEPLLTGRPRPLVSSSDCTTSICSGGRMRSSCSCGRRNRVSHSQWIAKHSVERRKRTVPLKAEIQKGKRQMEETNRISTEHRKELCYAMEVADRG
jgi:hypothetical protein